LSEAISSQFILEVCTAAKGRKKTIKPLILGVQGLSKSSMLIRPKSSLVITSACCDRQHVYAYVPLFSG